MKPNLLAALALACATPALAQTPDPAPSPTVKVAPPPVVQSTSLQAPDLFSPSGASTGLPDTLWRGASASIARSVIAAVSQRPLSPAGQALARRLLSTGAPAPDGAGADVDLAAARIMAVLSLGDAAGARAMLDHTPGIAASAALSQVAVEADLVLGQDDRACQEGDALTQGKDAPYFRRLRAYCLAKAGNNDAAQLAYDLAESQAKDATYKRLMSAAVSGTPAGDASLRNGLDFALSRRLMLDLTPAVASAWRPVLTVLATNPSYPDDLHAAAAERLKGGPEPSLMAAPVLVPLAAGDVRSAAAARTQIQRNDAAGATALELALLDAALTTAQGRIDQSVMDQLIERGGAGDVRDRPRAQAAAAIYAALGAPMSDQARGEFASFDLGRSTASQARLLELQLASSGGAPGDAALLSLWLALDSGAAGPPPALRAEIVRGLSRAGFDEDARAYALEGLIGLMTPSGAPPAPRTGPSRKRLR